MKPFRQRVAPGASLTTLGHHSAQACLHLFSGYRGRRGGSSAAASPSRLSCGTGLEIQLFREAGARSGSPIPCIPTPSPMSRPAISVTTGSRARSQRGISAEYALANSSQFYGKVSGVGERTYGAAPSLVGDDHSSFDVEDLYIGWRSGKMLGDLGENVLDFTVGRTQIQARSRLVVVGWLLRRRLARRLLDQCAQSIRVCGDRAFQARQPHSRGLLSQAG